MYFYKWEKVFCKKCKERERDCDSFYRSEFEVCTTCFEKVYILKKVKEHKLEYYFNHSREYYGGLITILKDMKGFTCGKHYKDKIQEIIDVMNKELIKRTYEEEEEK